MPADPAAAPAWRMFTPEDQEAFAALSGDRNPIHIDPVAARRSQAGDVVVHGVHAVLWALDHLARHRPEIPIGEINSIRAQFQHFLYLNQPVSIDILRHDPARIKIALRSQARPCIILTLGLGPKGAIGGEGAFFPGKGAEAACLSEPRAPEFDHLPGMSGCVLPPEAAEATAARLFPGLCAKIPAEDVVLVALLSTVVGMWVPGLHSLFAAFDIRWQDTGTPVSGLAFEVREADPRFRLAESAVQCRRFSGRISAFMRMPPVEQPSLAQVLPQVRPGEFSNRRALVIGGSRGIGATIARAICAGGGSARITYATGLAQAEAVAADINDTLCRSACSISRWDVEDEGWPLADAEAGVFTHLYYCATGRIFGPAGEGFDRRRFDAFLSIYVEGLNRVVTGLLARRGAGQTLSLLYPSSVAVVERPKGMTEYAMAKAAGEILCADLARNHPGLTVRCPRLPRTLTDQTATVPPVESADALLVCLPLLRAEV